MNVLNYNKITLIGNLTADPKITITKSEKKLCSFQLAVNRRHLSADGNKATDFISCVAWGKQAEFLEQYFRKGSPVLVVGELQINQFTNAKGEKKYSTEVSVEDVRMVESPGTEQSARPVRIEEDDAPLPSEPPF